MTDMESGKRREKLKDMENRMKRSQIYLVTVSKGMKEKQHVSNSKVSKANERHEL